MFGLDQAVNLVGRRIARTPADRSPKHPRRHRITRDAKNDGMGGEACPFAMRFLVVPDLLLHVLHDCGPSPSHRIHRMISERQVFSLMEAVRQQDEVRGPGLQHLFPHLR